MYFDVNTYGSIVAFFLGLFLRLGAGEYLIGFEPFLNYPGNSPTSIKFPYKTMAMVVSLLSLLLVSYVAKMIFKKRWLPPEYDILQCNLAGEGRSIETQRQDIKDTKAYDNASLWSIMPPLLRQKVVLILHSSRYRGIFLICYVCYSAVSTIN